MPARPRPGVGLALAVLLLIPLTLPGGTAAAALPAAAPDPPPPRWELFGDGLRPFATPQADSREARFRLGLLFDDGGGTDLDLDFGTDLGLLRSVAGAERSYALTVRGLLVTRFDVLSESFDLLAADFHGGLAFGWRHGTFSGEALLYHHSAHLGDEVLDRGERRRIDYGREALRLLLARGWGGGRLLGGGELNLHAYPVELAWRGQGRLGVEQRFGLLGRTWDAGLDLRAGPDPGWSWSATAQLATELGFPLPESRRQRAFLELYRGTTRLGQYHDQAESYLMLGMSYEL